jgi:Tubulin-tyrosine ligase family
VKALWSYLAQQGVNVSDLWTRLEDLVVKTIVSGESAIAPLIREHVSSRYCCYELFGVDVLLDEHLNPWLLEVGLNSALEIIKVLFFYNFLLGQHFSITALFLAT